MGRQQDGRGPAEQPRADQQREPTGTAGLPEANEASFGGPSHQEKWLHGGERGGHPHGSASRPLRDSGEADDSVRARFCDGESLRECQTAAPGAGHPLVSTDCGKRLEGPSRVDHAMPLRNTPPGCPASHLPAVESILAENDKRATYVFPALALAIWLHCVCNYHALVRQSYHLILLIVGPWGTGKTRGVSEVLHRLGVEAIRVQASMLEDKMAGEPAKELKRKYLEASERQQATNTPCVLTVEDLDLGIGTFSEYASGTVNTKFVWAAFTELSDSPYTALGKRCDRVPIIATANSAKCLYGPVVRPGRCAVMHWEPTHEEILCVARHILREYSLTEAQFSALAAQTADFTPAHFGMLNSTLRGSLLARALGDMDAKKGLRAVLRGEVQTPQSLGTVSLDMLEEAIEAVRRSVASTQLDFTKGDAV